MRFSTDHYFQIGHAHYTAGKPCQDHALSRSSGLIACAIVSDGCSTGGNTDVGSRILTLGTLQAIRDHAAASNGTLATAEICIRARQQQLLGVVRPMLGLDRSDMLSTCAYAYFTQNGGFVHIQGDGVVGLKYCNGDIQMRRYSWMGNMPFYPAYEGPDLSAFVEHHGNNLHEVRLVEDIFEWTRQGGFAELEKQNHTLEQGIAGISLEISRNQLEKIDFAAVFTDGVTQIENLDWKDAVLDLLAFKTSAGEFAKRRMIRGIKDAQQIGHGPLDDISYAVIHVEQQVAEEGSSHES